MLHKLSTHLHKQAISVTRIERTEILPSRYHVYSGPAYSTRMNRASSNSTYKRPPEVTPEPLYEQQAHIKMAILDIDGTLIDSNDAHARAFDQAFKEHGKTVPFEEIRKMIGIGADKLIPRLTGVKKDSDERKAIADRKAEIFAKQEMPNLKPFPKVKEFVQALVDHGIKVAIASSAKAEELEKFEKLLGIESFISTRSCMDDVDSSKPDPDMVQAVLDKAKMKAEEAVMLGDTPYDIESAAKAGVQTVIVRCGGVFGDDAFKGALAIYDNPEDILKHFDETPFAKSSSPAET